MIELEGGTQVYVYANGRPSDGPESLNTIGTALAYHDNPGTLTLLRSLPSQKALHDLVENNVVTGPVALIRQDDANGGVMLDLPNEIYQEVRERLAGDIKPFPGLLFA